MGDILPAVHGEGGVISGKDAMNRRHRGEGSLLKRGRSWEYRYREYRIEDDGTEKPIHRSVSFGRLKARREAEQARDDFLIKIGRLDQPRAGMSLRTFWERYFVPEILPSYKSSTRSMFTSLFNHHLGPDLGSRKLYEISQFDVQHYLNEKLREGYSSQTVIHLRNCLSRAFGTALTWKWLPENPAKGLQRIPMQRTRESHILSVDEIRQLSVSLSEPARTMFILGVGRGLRIGELLGLQVSDVDLTRGVLWVRRRIYRKEVGTPKSKAGLRCLPLTPFMVGTLRQYLECARPRAESPWFFTSPTGHYVHERNTMTRQIEPTCRRLGIPRFGWHVLRHTFSTVSGEKSGASLAVLQRLLGHSDVETTLGYMHPLEESHRRAMELLDREMFATVRNFVPSDPLERVGPVTVN